MSSTPKYLTGDPEGIKTFLDKFDVFLFDCDGVLWSGDHLFPDTVQTLDLLRKLNKQIVFVTNNSTKSRADYQRKLTSMGIPASAEEVFGSSYSAAIYISRILDLPTDKRKVFIIGESGIEAELDSENIPHLGGSDPAYRRDITPEDYALLSSRDPRMLDPQVGVVLVGLDFHINYLKLSLAYHYITGPNKALFLTTNIDSTLPASGVLFPGAGTISAPLIYMLGGGGGGGSSSSTKAPPPLTLGKPSQAMMDAIEGKFHFNRSRACMVGDRLNTDILFGVQGGLGGTLAVLTGVIDKEDILDHDDDDDNDVDHDDENDDDHVAGNKEKKEKKVKPMAFVDRLGDLLEVRKVE